MSPSFRTLSPAALALSLVAVACGGAEDAPCERVAARLAACGVVMPVGDTCTGVEEIEAADCAQLQAAFGDEAKADGFFSIHGVRAGARCMFNVQCAAGLVCVPTNGGLPSRQLCATPRSELDHGFCDSDSDCAAAHRCTGEGVTTNGRCTRTKPAPATPLAAPVAELTVATYNTGLAYDAVALAEERRPLLATALASEKADVLCLNEVWRDADVELLKDTLRARFPYAFHRQVEDTSERDAPCGVLATLKLDRCVSSRCEPDGISAEECVQTHCADPYAAVGESCQVCLAANTASPTWCAVWPGARAYGWDGRNGLLMLSRLPIENARYTAFDTLLIKRGVLSATVGGHAVHCTHLTSDLRVVPYPDGRSFASWREELGAQPELVAALAQPGQCTILAGDLNMGPAGDGLVAEVPEAWRALGALGFSEPWAAPQCTWCKDNPLAGATQAYQLDHVLVRGCTPASVEYTRVFDEPVRIIQDGRALDTRLSDHYGLRARFRF